MSKLNSKCRLLLISALVFSLLAVDPVGSSSPEDTPITQIAIDGRADDWVGRPVLHSDPAGDAEEGALDLTTGYAFVNQNALYFLVDVVEPNAPFVQLDIEFKAGPKRLLISWGRGSPGGFIGDVTRGYEPIGETSFSSFALGSALEGRVDLRDLGSPETASMRVIRVMVGECCQYPAWHAADEWKTSKPTPLVDEVDPPRLVSDEPQYRLARRFDLPEGFIAERILEPPAPDLLHIVRSQGGVIYLQQIGLSAGISILDPDRGIVTPLLDLPQDIPIGTLVSGPNDTAFIPVGSELWRISRDGSHTVWARPLEGDTRAFTPDGRLLASSFDGTRILELHPDGGSTEIAAGFRGIDSIVATEEGMLFVSDNETGNIIRINPDGTRKVLAEGILFRDPMDLAIAPDGNLFLNSVATRFVQVNTNTGALTEYPSAYTKCSQHLADFVFSGPNRVIFLDPTWSQLAWADLSTGTNGLLVSNDGGNTSALAIGPDDSLYVGAWGCGEDFPAQVIKVSDDGSRMVYADGLRSEVTDLAFAPNGDLYVSTFDADRGSSFFRVSRDGALQRLPFSASTRITSIAFAPQSGSLLVAEFQGDSVLEYTALGFLIRHPIRLPKPAWELVIALSPNGDLYAYASEAERQFTGPVVERWLLQIDLDSFTTKLIFQLDRHGCCVMGNLSVDPDGILWWLVSPDYGIYRVDPDGESAIFARNLPIDPAAVVADSQGDVYFTSASGIYRIYRD